MTREQHLEILKLLSALEAWSFAEKHRLPDYLLERLDNAIDFLTAKVLSPKAVSGTSTDWSAS